MARYVTISALGYHYGNVNLNGSLDHAVDEMIQFLKGKVRQVLHETPDLIVLPENCDRPNNSDLKTRMDFYRCRGERILHALAEIAREERCYISYSYLREMSDGTWRNSTRMIDRNGEIAGTYNKYHPVLQDEIVHGIKSGKDAAIIECDFGRVGCAICFDLNFDEIRQKYAKAKPDLIVFSSIYHGALMQPYWAYSCRAHFVGAIVNGTPCSILSPLGLPLAYHSNHYDYVSARVNLDCRVIHLDKHFEKLNVMREKYKSKVKIVDPGYLGAVLISSETDEFTIQDIIQEFDFQLIDDYFAEQLAGQRAPENVEA